jgi:peptidoglycan hydrolase-like protein with peptidoglycan-binding domain
MAGLGVLSVLLVAGVVIPLVVFDTGGKAVGETTVLTTTAPPVTTLPQAPTTSPQTKAPAATPLRVPLPGGGTLRRGDRGSAVKQLQKALAALGYDPGTPDGVFGQDTQAAVVDFQRSNDLQPDGIVGAETARILNAALAERGVTG